MRKGDYKTLNVFVLDDGALGGFHGSSMPPWFVTSPFYSRTFDTDRCIISIETLPGGKKENYNNGMTLVHQVGHWFRLFHTFQGGCEENNGFDGGNMIPDTSASKSETQGCPSSRKSCPDQPGNDPVHNFMDTSYE